MKHSTMCKIRYALWSIPMTLSMRMKGIKTKGIVYSGGRMFAYKEGRSTITIGKNCRFMNWQFGNLIGLNHKCIVATQSDDAKLTIGDKCSFSGVSIWCHKEITIGNNVRVGANVTIMDSDQHTDDPRAGKDKPVRIKDNVWIGGGVTILKGVTIGKNSLIGAGSVVVKSIPENVIAAGNPCKVIRPLDEDTIKKLENK